MWSRLSHRAFRRGDILTAFRYTPGEGQLETCETMAYHIAQLC